MNAIARVALTLLVLVAGQTYAEQPSATQQRSTNVTTLPATANQSPFDFNHMGAGSDKSDELGVPYYNTRDL